MPSYDPIYLSLNDESRDIVAAMDDVVRRREKTTVAYQKWRRWPRVFVLGGVFFCALDFVLGYSGLLFLLLGLGLSVCGVALWIALRRSQTFQPFSPYYQTARDVLYTLRDDVAPKKFFFGHIDLTGPTQKSKVLRTGTSQLGRQITFYRDEWLSVKVKLYDGNMLRVSALERVKQRDSYWKRSRSGKMKMKPAIVKDDRQQLKVRLSVNPQVYDIAPALRAEHRIGQFTVDQFVDDGGVLMVSATTNATRLTGQDLLSVLRAIYEQLQRKTA
jgi:hypothetical protein